MDSVHVAISGIIGAGKTYLATELANHLGIPVYYEPVIDNARLTEFYEDMSLNSFSYQIYLLNKRFEQQQQIVWSNRGGVQDRSIYEDKVFARMLCEMGKMRQSDLDTYLALFENMSRLMRVPNLIIHLDVTPEESIRRIRNRNRECEKDITLEYLSALSRGYDAMLKDLAWTTRIVRVNWDSYHDIEYVAELVKKKLQD